MRDHPRLQHLTPHERDVLAEFLSRLRERCGDRIAHVWLFCSELYDMLIHGRTDLQEFGQRIIECLQRTGALSDEIPGE